MKRNLDICVISDVHLGTYGCHAEELLAYLKSVKVKTLIINGDFIDGWQFKKKYFPKAHLEVINYVIQMAISGVKVYYITGNHDDVLRKFSDIAVGPIHLKDSLTLKIQGEYHWFFHGDIFDASVLISPRLAMIAGKGYDYLIRMNRFVNKVRMRFGKTRVSISGQVKQQVKRAVKFVTDFEELAVKHAVKQNYNYVICGHIHRAVIQKHIINDKEVVYMNSGDWVESLTALEYKGGQWRLFVYEQADLKLPRSSDTDESDSGNSITVRTKTELEAAQRRKVSITK